MNTSKNSLRYVSKAMKIESKMYEIPYLRLCEPIEFYAMIEKIQQARIDHNCLHPTDPNFNVKTLRAYCLLHLETLKEYNRNCLSMIENKLRGDFELASDWRDEILHNTLDFYDVLVELGYKFSDLREYEAFVLALAKHVGNYSNLFGIPQASRYNEADLEKADLMIADAKTKRLKAEAKAKRAKAVA